MPSLFEPLKIRGVTVRNRIGVSPMCQYSSVDGEASDWHLVHLGSRAVGGAGLVMTEATAVSPEGRISPNDLGFWADDQTPGHRRLAEFIKGQGAIAGVQLAHAGRKAGRLPPWEEDPSQVQARFLKPEEGGWTPVAPSAVPLSESDRVMPHELTIDEIEVIIDSFASAAKRADIAGYDWIEVHAGHGYLSHSFNSPLSNERQDKYGGSLENRIRFTREVARAIRRVWPEEKVLAFRISYTDWVEGGWSVEDSVSLARGLKNDGVDIVDVSSGGSSPKQAIPVGAGYQLSGAERIKREVGIPVAGVGLITDPMQSDDIIRNGRADLVMLGREMLRDPYWPTRAALALGQTSHARIPVQYNPAYLRRPYDGNFSFAPISAPQVTLSNLGD
ncbi:MAG: NADH:flavin oxidoreductase/NADH oxidase [Congregibacter sp.]